MEAAKTNDIAESVFPAASGEMAHRVRTANWERTPLGPIHSWSASLRIAVNLCLNSRFPMYLWWGKELLNIYNDAYAPLLGNRHPSSLGKPAREIWHEIWDDFGPQSEAVLRGDSTKFDQTKLILKRHGYPEETYFTWSQSPIHDEHGTIVGLLCVCTEDTKGVLAAREKEQLAEQRQLALDASKLGWWHYDPVTKISKWDSQFKSIFDVSFDEHPNEEILKRLHPEDLPRVWAAVEAALNPDNPAPYSTEYRIFHSDGSLRWIEAHGTAHFEGEGKNRRATSFVGTVADVTERQNAERLLKENRERLKLALEAAKLGDWSWDAQSDIVLFSDRGAEIFGIALHPPLTWTQVQELLHPEDRELARKAVQQSLETHTDYSIEYRVNRSDGSQVWVSALGHGVYHSDGTVQGMVGVVKDVTDRQRADELLKAAVARQEFLVALNDKLRSLRQPDSIMAAVAEMVGQKMKVSRCCYGEVDHEQEYVTVEHDYTDNIASVRGLHRLNDYGPDLAQDIKTGRTIIVHEVDSDRRTCGSLSAWKAIDARALLCVSLVKEGKLVALFSLHHHEPRHWSPDEVTLLEDIAERTWFAVENARAEEAVQSRETQFRQLAESIPQLAWCARPDGYIFWYNKRWYEYTGTTYEDMEGWGWESVHNPAELPRVLESWKDALSSGTPWESIFPLRRYDGEFRPHLSRAAPLRDENGKIMLWFGTNTDITDQQKLLAEREVLLASEKASREQAERESRLKDEFLATLSHELRTPLNAILGWSQLIKKGTTSKEAAQEGVRVIERNALMQAKLIEDLLDMSRIISGKIRLDIRPILLSSVIDAACATVKPAAEAKGVTLNKMFDPLAETVSGDPSRIQQIVWNLLSNAVKFTPRGGKVDILLERSNTDLEISVQDTGEGISPEFLPHVFDRFRQADASTSRSHGGLGLGLSIVKQLAELHGGTVRAKSLGKGKGSTFIVSLPALPRTESLAHSDTERSSTLPNEVRSEAIEEPTLHNLRILIVDDHNDTRELLKQVLEQYGAVVVDAPSVPEALNLLVREQPEVLISDIGMPVQDGYDLIRQVRSFAAAEGGSIPAIALTAFARSEDRRRVIAAGYQMHLAKPIDQSELVTMIASLVGRLG